MNTVSAFANKALWPTAPRWVQDTTRELLTNAESEGVEVIVSETDQVPYPDGGNIVCSGYFLDVPHLTLAVSVGTPWEDAFPVLIHEHRHMRQCLEKSAVWTDLAVKKGVDCCTVVDTWLGGQRYRAETVKHSFKAVRAVEFDCEKRVIEFIKERNLPIDIKEYAQKANAYVAFYLYAEKHRKWRDVNSIPPYRDKAIYSLAPTKMISSERCSKRLMEAFEKTYGLGKKKS
jgi:hypothetical protein